MKKIPTAGESFFDQLDIVETTGFVDDKGVNVAQFATSIPQALNQKSSRNVIYSTSMHPYITRVTQITPDVVRSHAYYQLAEIIKTNPSLPENGKSFASDMNRLALAFWKNNPFAVHFEVYATDKGWRSDENFDLGTLYRKSLLTSAGVSPRTLHHYGKRFNEPEAIRQSELLTDAILELKLTGLEELKKREIISSDRE